MDQNLPVQFKAWYIPKQSYFNSSIIKNYPIKFKIKNKKKTISNSVFKMEFLACNKGLKNGSAWDLNKNYPHFKKSITGSVNDTMI